MAKAYLKVYWSFFGYYEVEFVPCEMCGKGSNAVHYIHRRGAGGNLSGDVIENLMSVCKDCHVKWGDKKQHKALLYSCHLKNVLRHKPDYDLLPEYQQYID